MFCHFPLWLLILLGCQPSWLYYKPGERVEATVLHYACQSEFKIIFGTRIQVQELVFPLSLSSTSDRWPCPSEDSSNCGPIFQVLLPKVDIMWLLGLGLGGRTKLATCSLSQLDCICGCCHLPFVFTCPRCFPVKQRSTQLAWRERVEHTRKLFHSLFSHLAPGPAPPWVPVFFLHHDPTKFQFPKGLSQFCPQFWVPSTSFSLLSYAQGKIH